MGGQRKGKEREKRRGEDKGKKKWRVTGGKDAEKVPTDTHSSTLPLKSLRIRSSTEVVTEAMVRCRLALTSAVIQ